MSIVTEDGPVQVDQMSRYASNREVLKRFVDTQLKEGTDYGTIPMGNNRESKPTLLKPGAEKVMKLFGWEAHFDEDLNSWKMGGDTPGSYYYVCMLEDANGTRVGEGRGAALIGERRGWTPNSAVKIALKRALVDAILRTAGMSEYFTQDLEDMEPEAQHAQPRPADSGPDRRPMLEKLAATRRASKVTDEAFAKALHGYGVERVEDLDVDQILHLQQRLEGLIKKG